MQSSNFFLFQEIQWNSRSSLMTKRSSGYYVCYAYESDQIIKKQRTCDCNQIKYISKTLASFQIEKIISSKPYWVTVLRFRCICLVGISVIINYWYLGHIIKKFNRSSVWPIHIVEFHSNSMHFSTSSIMHVAESVLGHHQSTIVHLLPPLDNQIHVK